ncbi:PREDICTED: protein sel-1 homolog 2 [Miniopterus natalensis]|uniref:protein sel-1 homolog 2 n=1 Tax=Miniopterus natalensis TaxID=291302 RepID=UPI0007A7218F|nr:PREDICTED: protein sel-1 homolog 2 [Miniopterus natalensis]
MVICKPGREPLPEPDHAGTLDLDFQPAELNVFYIVDIEAERHNKKQKQRNVTTKIPVNEISQFLSYILERRKLVKIINKRENLLEKKKNQHKLRIKGIQNKDLLKSNQNYLKKQAKKNLTEEGDQLFKMGIRILQQSKSQKQKAQAYTLFAKAADMGNLKAMEKMADALLFGNFGMQNITAAIQLYESLAKEGSYKAQNALGFLSSYGIGMEYNQAKALIYYTFGSAGGSMMSQMILGYRYLSGINVLQNCEAALYHYKKVADYIADKLEKSEGIPVEKVRLTERPENLSSNSEILDWDIYQYYKFLAERGDVHIQVSLGQLHLIGRKGLDQDYYKALYYFLKAAKAGSANAMALIGKMYLEGNDAAPQNNATAYKYFSMAANKGNAIGLHGLGLLYFYGKGVPVNYAEALKYFQKAAEKGWPNAQFQLGFMYYSGSGVWKDYKLAFRYFYLASQSGQPLAIYYLAEMYATGTGVLRSCRTAVEKRLELLKKRRCIQWHYYCGIELPFKDIHLARRLYDMAAQTSPDAHMPVFFALMKLETVHLFRDILFLNHFTVRWIKLDDALGPYWDYFAMGLIVAVLIYLLRNRYG